MKNVILTIFALFSFEIGFCQELKTPTEGKTIVYFVRHSSVGSLINFSYFDGDKYLGKQNGRNYFIYECDPGEHIFWVASENRDFIKGELKANAVYILEVRPTMGAVKAAVRLVPVSPEDEKQRKKIKNLIAKRKPTDLKGQEEDNSFFIKNGLERFEKIKEQVKTLNTNWSFY